VEEGQITKATKHLQYLATHLLSTGQRELAHTVLVEAEHIKQAIILAKMAISVLNTVHDLFIALRTGVEQMIVCPNCNHREVCGA